MNIEQTIASRQIKVMPLADLMPYANNANTHSDEQVKYIADSMKKVGWTNPVLIRSDKTILAGHGRVLAAKLMGLDKVPCITIDGVADKDLRAYILADNQLAKMSDWDLDALKVEFTELKQLDVNLESLGFDESFVDTVIPDKPKGNTDDDHVPEVAQNIHGVERGDVWQLGTHRLMCGDSTSKADVDVLMVGEKADMVFTDPPYGYSYESNYQSKHKMLKNDDKILNFLPAAYSALSKNSCAYLCGSHQTIEIWKPLFSKVFTYKNMIVWKKNNWSMGDLKGSYAGNHELILFGHKGRIELLGHRSTDVWEFDRSPPKDHPTQKPIDLIVHAISKVPGIRILDLFLGSGSTLIACEKTKRVCYGMEIDPHYCSVVIERWQQFTGKSAEKINVKQKHI